MSESFESQSSGFLLIDKPAGMTSHDVVDALRRITGIRRIGHAGTLDPFATGLLLLGVGRATKELGKLQGMSKKYVATMHFGVTSTTGDPTGTIAQLPVVGSQQSVDEASLRRVLESFVGSIEQIPPMYSAKKVGGKKLYELARRGENIERTPRLVTIYALQLYSFDWPLGEIEVTCSSGTYIRTLVEDIGKVLGCGAYTEALRRSTIGRWRIEDAQPLDALTPENWRQNVRSIHETLDKIAQIPYPIVT